MKESIEKAAKAIEALRARADVLYTKLGNNSHGEFQRGRCNAFYDALCIINDLLGEEDETEMINDPAQVEAYNDLRKAGE